jgi:hemolysin activation/secretion protein
MRSLLLVNENTNLEVAAVFVKRRRVGTADVILKVCDRKPLGLYLNANNYGKDLTTNF